MACVDLNSCASLFQLDVSSDVGSVVLSDLPWAIV